MSAPVLVTGAAGFIGMHVSIRLLRAGVDVIGIDRMGAGNVPGLEQLRRDRLAEIERSATGSRGQPGEGGWAGSPGRFTFRQADIANPGFVASLQDLAFDRIVHLAAQAGVRYSIERPDVYVHSNLVGMANMLELARSRKSSHFVFASSSSVYGGREQTPFRESEPIDRPVSFYAATKVANEAMAASYARLFAIPSTGLRFFTVYGPWGRPDMAPFLFTEAILRGEPIKVFGRGELLRDFTYVDDITEGVCRLLEKPPAPDAEGTPFAVYNIGNNRPNSVNEFIAILEEVLGRKAIRNELPIQPGDVPITCASIDRLNAVTGFRPQTSLRDGLTRFCGWFRDRYPSSAAS